jgi:hypothetical protein
MFQLSLNICQTLNSSQTLSGTGLLLPYFGCELNFNYTDCRNGLWLASSRTSKMDTFFYTAFFFVLIIKLGGIRKSTMSVQTQEKGNILVKK